ESLKEPVIALLAEIGFSAFEETTNGVNAYIEEPQYDEDQLGDTFALLSSDSVEWKTQMIPAKNWNAQWESDYEAVHVGTFCQIVPSFQTPLPDFEYTVLIDPKMSFGTGHHDTTRLMIGNMQSIDVQNKVVLDMGCGTGILGILATKMGASSVLAIDIDGWSVENTRENIELNRAIGIKVLLGDASALPETQFDMILANINRNILVQDIPTYIKHLASDGHLLISGFYQEDIKTLLDICHRHQLEPIQTLESNNWISISLRMK
ncbi:UNVERIFIED_CONTAM: hypothetical protein GTU68_015412, partial [Idotea baltica]|nr:hypothetical protein [Idotea baltica]